MNEIAYNNRFKEKYKNKDRKNIINESKYLPISLLLPSIILILFVVIIPMAYSFYLSFTNFSLINTTGYKFIGFNNYLTLFKDQIFWRSFGNTLIYITIAVNVEFLLGLIIANMMSHVIRGQGILRTIMMMPMMFAPILVGFQFKWVFNDQVGLVNNILYSITGHPVIIPWLIQKPLGFIVIIISEIWMSTPFMVIIFLAGIMSIPQELFEAADVDGASEWHKFRYITIPAISPFIYIAMAIRSLDIAKAYDLVSIITGGGPAHRTELIWTYVYRLAFTSQKFALGSSMSFITVLLSFAFTFYLFRNILKARKI
jgi:multiple sugar transport system permease protein